MHLLDALLTKYPYFQKKTSRISMVQMEYSFFLFLTVNSLAGEVKITAGETLTEKSYYNG